MKQKFVAVTMTSMLAVSGALLTAGPAHAAPTAKGVFDNCTSFNKTYPHGVGRATARDRTSGAAPVTTWKRSTPIYNRAMSINSRLDGDKDGIACEKK